MTQIKLATIAAIVLAILYGAHWLFQLGGDSAVISTTKANDKAENAADAAERCVLAGKWNREAGKCEP